MSLEIKPVYQKAYLVCCDEATTNELTQDTNIRTHILDFVKKRYVALLTKGNYALSKEP